MSRGIKSRHDQAVDELRSYFGTLSQDDLFNVLVGSGTLKDQKKLLIEMAEKGAEPTSGIASLINLFQSQETGFFAYDIIDKINKYAANAPGDAKKILGKTFTIVYENSEAGLSNAAGCGTKTSMNRLTSALVPKEEQQKINEATKKPSKDKPSLAAFVIHNNQLNPSSRSTPGVEIFLNSIPSIEMSRCVPFLDIVLIPSAPALSETTKEIQTISLLQFLKGNFEPKDADLSIANAVDLRVRNNILNTPPPKVADEDKKRQDPSTTSAGMEIFTMPQTMVMGDEAYQVVTPQSRAAPVIDRFRPFMSLKDFKVDLSPSAGLMTFKTADINVVLHDRSRLSEISEFVKPDMYGRTEMIITYGWSHPDGLIEGNVYGKFLDSLKCTEKYGIINSSFSFDEVGQVDINLKLSLKGSSQIELTKISEGEGVKEALSQVKKLTEALKAQRVKMAGGKKGAKKIDGSAILSKLSDTGSAMGFDIETEKKVDEFINSARTSKSKDISEIVSLLKKMKFELPKAQINMANLVANKVTSLAEVRIDSLKNSDDEIIDPFIEDIQGKKLGKKSYVNIKKDDDDYISFGTLLLQFAGRSLAATGQFDEVQFVFYSFNDHASYMRTLPICAFPIRFSSFATAFQEKVKTTTNMSVGQFISFISSKFITSQTAEAYGLTTLYELEKKTTKLKLKKAFEDKTILKGEKDLRLEDAYGGKGTDLRFRVPRIQMQAECLIGESDGQTIYRIHVYDQNCTSYTSLSQILRASESETLESFTSGVGKTARDPELDGSGRVEAYVKSINKALEDGILEAIPSTTAIEESDLSKEEPVRFRVKSDFEKVKNYLRGIMPSLIYGSSNTNIASAGLSSMNNPALATINMRRSGLGSGTTALGLRESGLPLQIAPMKLQLTTAGCPFVTIGQQFFIDFGTGTSADNIYSCTKVSHALSAGTFNTTMEFTPLNAYGQYTNLGNVLDQAVAEIESGGKK